MESWTADFRLKDRIEFADLAPDYVPDYRYILVHVHDFSTKELIKHGDEMALVMMINKVQTKEDFTRFRTEARNFLGSVMKNTSQDIREVLLNVVWTLLMPFNRNRFNDSARARRRIFASSTAGLCDPPEDNDMGKLFANMEPMDIQKERDSRNGSSDGPVF